MPIDRALYPPNWEQISEHIRFERAGNSCEFCGAKNAEPHPETGSRVVLTVAHLNHQPGDDRAENLRALCQRCHLAYDAPYRSWRKRGGDKGASLPFDDTPSGIPLACKGLSVRQPWANMIADGSKTIETRTWQTNYRGPVLIVSSKKPSSPGPAGCAVALVGLVDCRPFVPDDEELARCDWYEGYAWVLSEPRRVKPIHLHGRLGLYDVALRFELEEMPS